RRGHVVVGQQHGNARVGEDFSDDASGAVGQKARVVSNNNADTEGGSFVLEDVDGDGSRHATYVVEGEVVGDQASPAVGTEFDLGHGLPPIAGRRSLVIGRSQFVIRSRGPKAIARPTLSSDDRPTTAFIPASSASSRPDASPLCRRPATGRAWSPATRPRSRQSPGCSRPPRRQISPGREHNYFSHSEQSYWTPRSDFPRSLSPSPCDAHAAQSRS